MQSVTIKLIQAYIGRVVDGVLVVYDSESVFSSAARVHCMSAAYNASHSAALYLSQSICKCEGSGRGVCAHR